MMLHLLNDLIALISKQGLSLSNTGVIGEDKKPTGYSLKAQCSDVLHYQTIPLSKLKSLELHSSTGVTTETNVIGVRPCWLLRVLGAFCGCCQVRFFSR